MTKILFNCPMSNTESLYIIELLEKVAVFMGENLFHHLFPCALEFIQVNKLRKNLIITNHLTYLHVA